MSTHSLDYMRLTVCLMATLILFFRAASVSADQIVYPADIPNAEHFDDDGLVSIQKMVDEGHQPWRFDPEYYAKHFMNSYYPNLDPNEREKLPASLELKGHSAIVKIVYEGKEHTVYLHKAFPLNPESIWIVDKMAIAEK